MSTDENKNSIEYEKVNFNAKNVHKDKEEIINVSIYFYKE